MDTASRQILLVLEQLVKSVPIGTNLALLQLMWVMLSGHFLTSRGAVHTALQLGGLSKAEVKRCWQALRFGVWSVGELLSVWEHWVEQETSWQAHRYDGWQPLAFDLTTFWRPKLKNWVLRGFHQVAGHLLPGVVLGVVVRVGHIEGQRLPLLHKLLRAPAGATDEEPLKAHVIAYASRQLAEEAIAIFDGGFNLKALQDGQVPRFVVRLASNCVLRRNVLPQRASNKGRPAEYGSRVRPLARTYKGNLIEATPPDTMVTFKHDGHTITANGWLGVIRSDQKVNADHACVDVWCYQDPRYLTPLIVANNVSLSAAAAFQLYLDRWPVEQVPLVAKQMLGVQRMFVYAAVTVWRLPELALLLGNILTILAAVLPPMPTGYWDRSPKKRVVACAGRCTVPIFPN